MTGAPTRIHFLVLMGMSIGSTVSCFITPVASNLLRTKKWILVGAPVIAIAAQVALLVRIGDIARWWLFALLFIFAFSTNPVAHVLYALTREYYPPEVASTAGGCINAFAFLSSAVRTLTCGLLVNTLL